VNALVGLPGYEIVLSSFDAASVWGVLDRERVTDISLVSATAAALLGEADGRRSSTVTNVHLGGGPTTPEVATGLQEAFPSATVWNRYGLTESGRLRIFGEYDSARPGRIGFPRRGQGFRIVSACGGDAVPGQVGELWVRDDCPYRRSYWPADVEGEVTFLNDGWITTGDLVRYTAEVGLEFVSRASEAVIVDGLKISLPQVDGVLMSLTGVESAASFVVQSRRGQAVLCAAVVTHPDTSLAQVRATAVARLGRSAPRAWSEVDVLPTLGTGKIDRRRLAAEMSRGVTS
jgi:acyl-CoA synthetase (AMP-forming)/AMP-acid ligase II